MLREVLPGLFWEIGVLWGVLARVLRKTGGAPGSAPQGAQCGGSTGREPSGALPGAPPVSLSTLASISQSTPISQNSPGSTSRSTSRDFPVSTPVPDQGDCKVRAFGSPQKSKTEPKTSQDLQIRPPGTKVNQLVWPKVLRREVFADKGTKSELHWRK